MADRFYLILEILAVLLCLHGLYGEKFKWNSYTILFVVIEFIAFQVEDTYNLVTYRKIILYVMLFVYSKLQFRSSLRKNVINYILCIVLTIMVQLICYFPIMIWNNILSGSAAYVVNILLFISVIVLYKIEIFHSISLYMLQEGKLVIAFLSTAILFVLYTFYSLQVMRKLNILNYFLIIISVILILVLLLQLQKTKLLNQKMKMEIKLTSLYGNAFKELIDNIRIIQHNYKNNLTALQGMVYTSNSLEELREEQKNYFEKNMQEDKFYSILKDSNDSVLAGFLYSKLSNIDQNDIKINFDIHVNKINNKCITSDLIEILGALLDNAIEEVSKAEYIEKSIEIKIIHINENIDIGIGNVCRYIKNEEILEFFKKGISTKGKNRGLGLYRIKEIVKSLNGRISAYNIDKDDENWFYIKVEIPDDKRL